MEVVNHQTESDSAPGRLSLNDTAFDRDSSPIPNNDNENSLENRISSKFMTNKFKRIFQPGTSNESGKNDSTNNSSYGLSNKGLNQSIPSPINSNSTSQSESISENANSASKSVEDLCEIVSSSSEDASNSLDQSAESTSHPSHRESNKSNEKEIEVMSIDSNGEGSKDSHRTQENGDGALKIQMVTTLGNSDIFVEAPSGPISPVMSMSNPLESDKEETRDSVITSNEKDSTEKPSSNPSESSAKGSEASVDKDSEQDEVITGDKTINLNTSGDKDDSDKSNSNESDKNDGCPKIKVIYPKKKPIDIGQIKITRSLTPFRKNCLHCSKLTNCDILINIGGSECFLCSEECLKLHKADQINALQRKNCPVIPPQDQQEWGAESRICVNCDANVSLLPEDKILSWETMEFCNEDCLSKYQTKMWSFCTACKKDVPTSSMGKYCVRFGHEVKQFCCGACLEEFKKGIKVCCYCQKDLSANEEGFLAPIGERGQFKDFCSQTCLDEYYYMSHNIPGGLLKVEPCGVCDKTTLIQVQVITSPETTVNLCSMVCLAAFKFVNTTVSPVPCYMCKKYYLKTIPNAITVYYENELLTFCSKSCMNINILAKRRIVACSWCKVKKYNFDMIRRKSSTGVTNWCSVNCMALYQVSVSVSNNTSRMPCTYCKKVEVPHLHLTMSDATVRNFCSMDCVNAFQTSFPSGAQANGITPSTDSSSVPVIQPVPTGNLQKKPGEIKVISPAAVNGTIQAALVAPGSQPVLPPIGQSSQQQIIKHQILIVPQSKPQMCNVKIQVRPNSLSRAVTVKVNKNSKGTQTLEEKEEEEKGPVLIPIPVPIYIPCPMAMYSVPVPTPIPIPIPVPVPIIIPTTKGTADEILADIKRIQEQMPGNPYEAELLLMAQMVEGKKTSREEDTSQDCKRTAQKRPVDDILDEDVGPPEKKRKGDTEIDALGSTIHHLAVSRLPMSLKETLGVSAWKNYAAMSGEDTDLLEMRPAALAQALKGFILNAKIPGGGHYTPDQKYYLMLGIQYYLQENGRVDNIFHDKLMDPFIKALDDEAKAFQNMFSESDNIVTRVEEEHLWESKQLGPQNPSSLLATLIYFNTKYFNLTTVEEHMKLSFKDFVNHWKKNSEASPSSAAVNVLRFITPDSILESNPKKKKVYEQEANTENIYRCPVQLYEFYLSKCPKSVKTRNDLFYLNPERSFLADSPTWYSAFPLSEEEIVRTLNRFKMVKEINIALLSS